MFDGSFSKIQFPIYYLGHNKPTVEGKKIYMHYVVDNKHEENEDKILLVDDRSIEADSLALRRLQLKNSGVKLAKLKYAVFFIGDMLKLCKGTTWFIDSEGNLFEYRKTRKVPLVFRKISQIIPLRTGGAIVEVQGIGTRFKVLHAPSGTEKWAGLLLVGVSYILYGLYDTQLEDTVRAV